MYIPRSYLSTIYGILGEPQGRLTLTTAVPVLTSAVTAATTVYYTPYVGSLVPIYNGSFWVPLSITELSLVLDSDSGHTGYHQSGKNFDLFIFNDSGTVRLASGPAWTDDTTRADALTRLSGHLVNNASIVLRFGSAAGNTKTVLANRALYVGTFRASANGQTEFSFGGLAASGTEAKLYLWNCFNRCITQAVVRDSTNSWTLATGNIRAANGSSTMRVSFVVGQKEDWFNAEYGCSGIPGATGAITAGVGYNSTTAFSGSFRHYALVSGVQSPISGWDAEQPFGYNYFQAMESSQGTTSTFYGDANVPTYVQNGLTMMGTF